MQTRCHARQRLEEETGVSLVVTKFGTLEQADLYVRTVDISAGGLCIESKGPLDHGYVRLRDRQGKQRNGVMVWSKKLEEKQYRAGIRFLPLGPSEGAITSGGLSHPCLTQPDAAIPFVSMLVEELPRRPFSQDQFDGDGALS